MKNTTTRLKRWLDAEGITQREFARRVSIVRRKRCSESQLSHWVTGVRIPDDHNRYAIEAASLGNVPVRSWAIFKKQREAKSNGK